MSQIQEAWALDLAGRLGVPTSATQQTVDLTRGQASLLISALRGDNAGPTGLNTDATRFANTVRDIRAAGRVQEGITRAAIVPVLNSIQGLYLHS